MMTIDARAHSYIQPKAGQLKFHACFCKHSGRSKVLFFTPDGLEELIAARSNALLFKEDGIRWAGLMTNKLDRHTEFARLTINCPWNKFQVGKNGFMSDAQEQAVMDALKTAVWEVLPGGHELVRLLQSLDWEWTGHNHRRGVHDLHAVLPDGTEVWIEVKGIHGRLFYS